MSDVFDEVDEQLRKERAEALWKRFAPFIIGTAVAVIVVVVGYQYWNSSRIAAAATSGDQFLAAISEPGEGETPIVDQESTLLSLIKDGSNEYPSLAKFKLASNLSSQGETSEAIRLFSELQTETKNVELQSIALVRKGYLLLEGGSYEDLAKDLSSLDGNWSFFADEILGVAAFKEGELQKAANHFDIVARASNAPESLRQRADKALSVLASSGIFPKTN